MITSPYAAPTDRPATLDDLRIFRITGALFIHEAKIIPIPTPLAIRRVKHGVDSIGKDSRHVVGVTNGDGSEPHAQLARCWIRGLSIIRPILCHQG